MSIGGGDSACTVSGYTHSGKTLIYGAVALIVNVFLVVIRVPKH